MSNPVTTTGHNNNQSIIDHNTAMSEHATTATIFNSPPTGACNCCWSLETDAEGHVRSVRLVGWGGQTSPEAYGLALHAICHLKKLQSLELVRYPLSALPVCIQHLNHSLTTLSIEGAELIRELPAELGNLTSLERLTIKDLPHLQAIPVAITQLPNLERLSFEGCYDIRAVPREIGRLSDSLRRLTFRDLNISSLPDEICRLAKLEYLELADFGVDFKLLPADLGDCSELQTVYVELEYLKTFPASIGKLQKLEELITQGCCYLESLPKAIKECSKLQSLWLYDTDPDALVEFFNEPWEPERYAASPRFVSLEKSLLGPAYKDILPGLPSSVLELNLGGNEIDCLQDAIDLGLPDNIRALALQENPVIEGEESRHQLRALLHRYPRLGSIDHKEYRKDQNRAMIGKIINEDIFLKMIMNQSGGRSLLENKAKKDIPMALWPLVMEKLPTLVDGQLQACRNEEDFSRSEFIASAIYTMLQDGPALLNAEHERLRPPKATNTTQLGSDNLRKRKLDDNMVEVAPLWDMFLEWHEKVASTKKVRL